MNSNELVVNHLDDSTSRSVVFDTDELKLEQGALSSVVTHTVAVFHSVEAMRRNAVDMCISMRDCKSAYQTAFREKYPDRKQTRWEAFCKANFEQLGLSQGQIRQACQTGDMLINLRATNPDSFTALSNLSKSALFAVTAAPETLIQIQEIIEATPGSTVTAAQVNQMRDALRASEDAQAKLQMQLDSAVQSKKQAEEVVADLNARCMSNEEMISNLRTQAKTPVESLVHALPPGVASEQEAIDRLEKQNSEVTQTLAQTNAEVAAAQNRLTDVQRKLNEQTEALDVLAALNKDIASLTGKYSRALISKVTTVQPNVKPKFVETAQLLRSMADQLSMS